MKQTPISRWLTAGVLTLGLLAACAPVVQEEATPAEPEVPEAPCVVIPPPPTSFGYDRQAQYPIWQMGSFNPANPDEAAVVVEEMNGLPSSTSITTNLYRRNLRTGQQQLLANMGGGGNKTDWSPTGWILYGKGGEAWKVKANGDSAQQITRSSGLFVEMWSPDGRQFVCLRTTPTGWGVAIYTAAGALVRMLPYSSTAATPGVGWSPDGRRLAYMGGPGFSYEAPRLCVYDLTTNQITLLDVLPRSYPWNLLHWGVRWLPNGTDVMWASATGIGLTNTQTGQTSLIRANCPDSRFFVWPTPSADGQQILVCRQDVSVSPINAGMLLDRSSLETMTLQGTKIRKVTP